MTAAIYIRLSLEDDDLIDGKSESESITKTARLEDWIVADDCHEPLVSKNLLQKAQKQLGGEYKQICQRKIDNPLSRKVYRGVCHYAIVRRDAKNKYYRCGRPRTVPEFRITRIMPRE